MADNKGTSLKARQKKVVAEALRIERGNARQDSARQKSRREVSGGGAKPWRQKGTGRARQGSTRAIHWVGGGRAFNTSIENHHRKINKKVRRQALAAVLNMKKESGLVVVDAFKFDAPSTKTFRKFLEDKEIQGKTLFIHDGSEEMAAAVKSARNLPNVQILHSDALNLQALLNTESLLTSPAVAERLNLN